MAPLVTKARPQTPSLAALSRCHSYVVTSFILDENSDYGLFSRGMSSQPLPSEKASEIINNLPSSPNLVTKTGTVILGTGLLATAISQELYVMNEETVIAAGFFLLVGYLAKVSVLSSD
jgi:Mitochondrial ATP synthase B chain precursor (ATP-synt_B)